MKKRILSLFLTIILLISYAPFITVCSTAEALSKNDFEYSVSFGEVTIEKYVGSATNLTIPDTIDGYSVIHIGESAFEDCTALEEITISDRVVVIDKDAFRGCTSLKRIEIPSSVRIIEEGAFRCCVALEYIQLPNTVAQICDYTFTDCYALQSIEIPGSVTKIGDYAFQFCSSLKSISIPDKVTEIGEDAFNNCKELQTLTLGNGVTTIKDFSFSGCLALESITIPDSVKNIGEFAFYYCDSLKQITIGKGVSNIGSGCFIGLSALQRIDVATSNNHYTSVNGILFNKIKTLLVAFPATKTGTYIIPDGVTIIDADAFQNCTALTSITIPNSVTYIGECAFGNCTALKSVYYNDSKENWDSIYIESFGNTPLLNANINFKKSSAHQHSFAWVVDSPATCSKAGSKHRVCKYEGCSYTDKWCTPIAAGHKSNSGKITKKASTKSEGKKVYRCKICNKIIKTEKIPKTSSIKNAKSLKKKQVKVYWKKDSKVSGYQILLATNSKFTKGKKTVTVKGYKTTSKTIKSLKSKKTYYVKLRSYKTVSGKKIYGAYSKVKKIKIK